LADKEAALPQGSPTKRRGSLTSRTLIGFLWQLGNRLVEVGGRVLVMLILARLLTPGAFGVASAGLLVASLGQTFTLLGVVPALVQRPVLTSNHIGSATVCTLGMSLIGFVTIWFGADAVAAFFRMPELRDVTRAIALVFPLSALSRVPEALLMRDMAFRKLASIDMASFLIGYAAVGIGMALTGWGLWSLVAAQLCQILLRTVLVLAVSSQRWTLAFDFTATTELLNYGIGHTLAELGNVVALQGDNIVVGRVLGATPLGLYGRAYGLLAQPAALVGTVFDRVLFPAMSQVKDGETERLVRAQLRALAAIALVMIPGSLLLVLLAPELIRLLLGPRWLDVIVPFQVLSTSMLFRSSYKVCDSVARARGATYRRAVRQWIYAGLVVAGAGLGSFWGLAGVSVGVALAVFINYALMLQLSLAVTGGRLSDVVRMYGAILTGLLPTFGVTIILVLLLRGAGAHQLITLSGTGAATAAVELLSLALVPRLFGAEAQWAVSTLQMRIPSFLRS
jgi:PST family polysaccharide transporter